MQILKYIWISGSKEYDVPFDINLRDVNGQTVLYLACCVGNLKIVELLLKYQVKARKISGKTATLKKKKIGSKDDQSRPSMVATRTTFQTGSAGTSQSSIQVSFSVKSISRNFFVKMNFIILNKFLTHCDTVEATINLNLPNLSQKSAWVMHIGAMCALKSLSLWQLHKTINEFLMKPAYYILTYCYILLDNYKKIQNLHF